METISWLFNLDSVQDLNSRLDISKFVYSEKATKFCEISTLLLSTLHTDKSKVEISQNFVAFSEYVNFIAFFRKKRFGKRTVDFMGMQVSMPQYLRLVALQEKVIQLDKILRKMKQYKTEEELAQLPQWQRYFFSKSNIHYRISPSAIIDSESIQPLSGLHSDLKREW